MYYARKEFFRKPLTSRLLLLTLLEIVLRVCVDALARSDLRGQALGALQRRHHFAVEPERGLR